MPKELNDETVDRSRLRLLGVLAAAGASGACTKSADDPLANLTGTLGAPAEITRLRKENDAATKARADRKKAEWEALVRRNKEYEAKKAKAIKRIKKYGTQADYDMLTGGEGESGGGSH